MTARLPPDSSLLWTVSQGRGSRLARRVSRTGSQAGRAEVELPDEHIWTELEMMRSGAAFGGTASGDL